MGVSSYLETHHISLPSPSLRALSPLWRITRCSLSSSQLFISASAADTEPPGHNGVTAGPAQLEFCQRERGGQRHVPFSTIWRALGETQERIMGADAVEARVVVIWTQPAGRDADERVAFPPSRATGGRLLSIWQLTLKGAINSSAFHPVCAEELAPTAITSRRKSDF